MCVQSKNNNRINVQISKSKQENWWEEAVVQYGFNFPSVRVNLERLMGTNIVQMTDPAFMLDLRDRVWTDYDTKLTKRINEREVIEKEREAKLILKGVYNVYNRPRKFIPHHSRVLALDLGSQNFSNAKRSIDNNDEERSTIFKINERTNETINQRRLHISSTRQKNVDRIIRQTKLQGLRPNIEHDELAAIEGKIQEIQNKILDKKSKSSKVQMKKKKK